MREPWRTTQAAKALSERAAALMGPTVSGCMLHNDDEAARHMVADHDNLALSEAAFQAFLRACEDPSEPNEALHALMARR